MGESENTYDRIFKDESGPEISEHTYECSDAPNCEWRSNCKGDHAYSLPSYLTRESYHYPRSAKAVTAAKSEEQEVDQIVADSEDGPVVADSEESSKSGGKPLLSGSGGGKEEVDEDSSTGGEDGHDLNPLSDEGSAC